MKWEYKIVDLGHEDPDEIKFDEFGREGWELVVGAVDGTRNGWGQYKKFYIFKRKMA